MISFNIWIRHRINQTWLRISIILTKLNKMGLSPNQLIEIFNNMILNKTNQLNNKILKMN